MRSGATWSQQAYLKASNTGAGDLLGLSAAISGDTVVVGAFGEGSGATGVNGHGADNSANNSGAVYVFVRNGATWSQQAYLKASDTAYGNRFSCSVGVSGDSLIVGSRVNGAAYLFRRNGGSWAQTDYLVGSNTETLDNLGWSVDLSVDTIVVGAEGEGSGVPSDPSDNSAPGAGATYVFR